MKIDIHTHIMPPEMPKFKERFGYGGFIQLDHHKPCCARMLRDDGTFFREVQDNCYAALPRLKDCDAHGVDVQVLSTIPVLFSYWAQPKDGLIVARFLNDHIASVVAEHPQRFIGLGTLPFQDADLAIQELERCMGELNFAGIEIGTHVNEWNLEHDRLFPVFEACEKLGAAVFVHPWDMMGQATMPKYWLPWLVGMPAESSRAICSMIFGGVFERLPNLRVAFAHGGGSFGATLGRIEHGFKMRPDLCAVDNPVNPRDYLGRFWVDALTHDPDMLRYIIKLYGIRRVAMGSDYPFPLGEVPRPGELIETMEFSDDQQHILLVEAAQEWLGISSESFIF